MASSSIDRPRPQPQLPPERFAELVTPVLNLLIRIAWRILRSDDLAWDAVQEALLTLWLEAELPSNPRAWLIRTVVNRCLHLSRTRARRRKYEGLVCRTRPEASDRDEPARKIENEDLLDWLSAALTRIAPEQSEVLVLRVVEEMDYESIARALQIPLGTVRSRLNRSRRALEALLRELLPEENHKPGEPHERLGSTLSINPWVL